MAYMYQAALYCPDCGRAICDRLDAEGKTPADDLYDTDDYPRDVGAVGESDSPDHCDAGRYCLRPLVLGKARHLTVGAFLDNELTNEGIAYVRSVGRRGAVGRFWHEVYQL